MADLREAFGQALLALGARCRDLVVLDADLSKSTRTAPFAKRWPARFFDMGIAEADMMGTAAGLALGGQRAVAATFAMFAAGRAWEQVRNGIAHNRAAVTIVATHAGLSVGPDGATHQCLEDLALMRAVPGMRVYAPGDEAETVACLEHCVNARVPAYIRLPRGGGAPLHGRRGKPDPRKAYRLRDGNAFTLASTGTMAQPCLEAADRLSAAGYEVRVVHSAGVQPLAPDEYLRAAQETVGILSVEEHSVNGGFGDAVSRVLEGLPAALFRAGTNGEFGESGSGPELLALHGLTADKLAARVAVLLRQHAPAAGKRRP